jgi:large subunit ribosomal protein L20
MTRIKRGFVARKRRKKVLNLTKGFRGSSSVLFRPAAQRKMKALKFAYRDRQRKRDVAFGLLELMRRVYNLNYSQFIYKFKQLNIHVNRKWLAQLQLEIQNCSTNLFKWSSKHYL